MEDSSNRTQGLLPPLARNLITNTSTSLSARVHSSCFNDKNNTTCEGIPYESSTERCMERVGFGTLHLHAGRRSASGCRKGDVLQPETLRRPACRWSVPK